MELDISTQRGRRTVGRLVAGGGAALGVLLVFLGLQAFFPRMSAPAYEGDGQELEFLDGKHRTRTVTRVGPNGETYQIKVVDDGRPEVVPVDPLVPSLTVGLGIALFGISGAGGMLVGRDDEDDDVVAAPEPLVHVPPSPRPPPPPPGIDSPAVFSDEDVLRAMQEAEER